MNMQSLLKLLASISLVLFIGGCRDAQQAVSFLEVELTSDKRNVKMDEPFTLTVAVAYGEKDISRDVIIEVEFIEDGISLGSVNPEYLGNGRYELEMKLISEGEHIVVAHASYGDYYETRFLTFHVTE